MNPDQCSRWPRSSDCSSGTRSLGILPGGSAVGGVVSNAVDLDLEGMTCASCAARIEKKLNALPGVEATVNFATHTAHVEVPPGVSADDCVAAVEKAGYGAAQRHPESEHDHHSDPTLLRRLIVAAVLAVPVVIVSMTMHESRTATLVAGLLATPVVWWAAWPFHRAAFKAARHGSTTMDTLVSLGIIAAYGWSIVALFTGGHVYFEVAVTVATFLLAGRYAESRAKDRAGEAVAALLKLGAKDATVLRDGQEVLIPIAQLRVGDEFVVRPGERIATDSVVVSGASSVDNALITGESVPVEVGPGDALIGAAVNQTGRLVARAERVGADTELAQIAAAVERAQTGKAPVQRLADRVSSVFVPVVLVLSVLTAIGWLIAGAGWSAAFTAAVAVLIIACPCALGLATPTAILVGTGRGAQLGVLIAGPEILERTRSVDTVVLDKTGTLTRGNIEAHVVSDDPDFGRFVGTLESASEHPVGRAIAAVCPERGTLESFEAVPGRGVRGTVDGVEVVAGTPAWMRELGFPVGDERASVVAAWDGRVRGAVLVSDTIRETSVRAVAQLQDMGLRTVLLTGDSRAAARDIGEQVGIDEVIAEVKPLDKQAAVADLQAQGHRVAMVGDGVNDSAALAQADLGIAMGAGADVAISASDITLVRSDPLAIVDAIRLSRQTLRIIKQNLFWAFAYNSAAIPLAMAGLLTPMIAGAAMAFSSVFVVLNSLRLRRFRSVQR
ncbi:MAG: cadmium-translocating P-type ATPase [Actinobacteria bacterium]|nr:cadmium-translocating P-type ATPase [Actinomycetota bacterium]MCB8995669.1 cadmium-translocating P-type ATPase [Actinomycetota bacterium]MCB9413654.1 cadmium-translocating P-type ATPase [Actinomycetota bacterium]